MSIKSKTVIFLLFFSFLAKAQIPETRVDTIDIYRNKAGVRFRTYMFYWFQNYRGVHSFGYNPSKLNRQDSLVMFSNTVHYFRVYKAHNKLIFSAKNGYFPYLTGEIKYYDTHKRIKRIEYYNNTYTLDTCNSFFRLNDAPGKEGKWTYFDKKGRVKKTVEYYIYCISCSSFDFEARKRITLYRKDGTAKSIKIKKT
ncbi:MAG: hypothetical protein JST26_04555 [Bacteroidetes bacterium]|nr:hypothetical protein [Bacteroidota bacterium]